jgi:hypothetical protein
LRKQNSRKGIFDDILSMSMKGHIAEILPAITALVDATAGMILFTTPEKKILSLKLHTHSQ